MLKQRVLTAIFLLAGFFGTLFLMSQPLWLGLISLVCGAAAWEWGALNRFTGPLRIVFAVVSGVVCFAVGWFGGLSATGLIPSQVIAALYVISIAFWVVLVPQWLKCKWQVRGPWVGALVGWIVLIPAALALIHLRQIGPWFLLAAMSLVWIADIAAYFTGRAFGRHKLAPLISPGKTWEGAAGALGGVVVAGLLYAALAGGGGEVPTTAILIPFLLVLTAISIEGDLLESMLKRQAGVKDSGTLLPGHGGILDRIDSLTSTLPLVALAALWFGY